MNEYGYVLALTVYDGKVIGFCCKDCIASFEKEPAKYVRAVASK
mgnify:CR=1 FL=1